MKYEKTIEISHRGEGNAKDIIEETGVDLTDLTVDINDKECTHRIVSRILASANILQHLNKQRPNKVILGYDIYQMLFDSSPYVAMKNVVIDDTDVIEVGMLAGLIIQTSKGLYPDEVIVYYSEGQGISHNSKDYYRFKVNITV